MRPARLLGRLSLLAAVVVSAMSLTTTLAAFSDQGEGRGRASAGSVDVVINDDVDDVTVLVFDGEACDNMAHGDSCQAPVSVRNAGTLAVTYNVQVIDSNQSCFTSQLDIEAELEAGDSEPGDPHADHEPGDVHEGTLTTVLDNDVEDCQGTTNRVTVVVHARQSRSPHR